ncbi:MAG: hypothetical protein UZ12_BCD005002322 [Bacteroidetes bacterium OLB12]|nr:MAG: hypothetical protein UZ12_BCD005002322 [Bacteroidetes bacterium OLB12]
MVLSQGKTPDPARVNGLKLLKGPSNDSAGRIEVLKV